MNTSPCITKVQLETSPNAKSQVVIHPAPQQTVHELSLPCNSQSDTMSTMRKSSSTGNIWQPAPELEGSANTHLAHFLKRTILNEVLITLPTLVADILEVQLVPAITKALNEESAFQSPTPKEESKPKYQRDIEELKKKQCELINKINGYKTQADIRNETMDKIENNVLPDLESRISTVEKKWSSKEKSLNSKTKSYHTTYIKMLNELEEITKIKEKWDTKLNEVNTEGKKVSEIDHSQRFVAAEYDEMKLKQTKIENDMKVLSKKVERQEGKTEQTANYSRLECAEFSGVPVVIGPDGKEDCKWQVIEICKELNYWIPEYTISTAHRKKQHFSKTGPPPIIVKFNCKDVRNDVLALRHQLKEKTFWHCFNIKKLYINESLTPDVRKLFYHTRILTQEMNRIHGKIFAWTFKGEIFIRKNAEGAPKKKIVSLEDLTKIKNGSMSIDPPTRRVENAPKPNIQRTNEERTADIISAMADLNICS